MKSVSKVSRKAALDPARALATPIPEPQARGPVSTSKAIVTPNLGGPLPSAVLIERFEAKIARDGIFLTLFGFGVPSEGAPLQHTPALTGYLSGKNAADLSKVLAKAVVVSRAMAVDKSTTQ